MKNNNDDIIKSKIEEGINSKTFISEGDSDRNCVPASCASTTPENCENATITSIPCSSWDYYVNTGMVGCEAPLSNWIVGCSGCTIGDLCPEVCPDYEGAFCSPDDGEPQEVEGCTDSSASNYNPDATVDDGSCVFISDYEGQVVIVEIQTRPNNSETRWEYIKLYNTTNLPIDLTGWSFVGIDDPIDGGFWNSVATDWVIPGYTTSEYTSGDSDGMSVPVDGHTQYLRPAPSPIIQPYSYMMFEAHSTSLGPGGINSYTSYDSSFQYFGNQLDSEDRIELLDSEGDQVDLVWFEVGGDGMTEEASLIDPSDSEWVVWYIATVGVDNTGKTLQLKNPTYDNRYATNWGPTTVEDNGLCDYNTLLYTNYFDVFTDQICSDNLLGGSPNRPNDLWAENGYNHPFGGDGGVGCTIKSADNWNPSAYKACNNDSNPNEGSCSSSHNINDCCCTYNNLTEDIIITEIHYNPAGSQDDTTHEFIEVYNRGVGAKSLYGVGVYLTNSYDSPIYVFGDVSLSGGDYLVLARNASFYQGVNLLNWGTNLFQWTRGSLSNLGERLELRTPYQLLTNQTGFAVIDYDNTEGWPSDPANSTLGSIEMVDTSLTTGLYDSSNWAVSNVEGGTPGLPGNTQISGCMDEGACNYNPVANVDDESCQFVLTDCGYCDENGDAIDIETVTCWDGSSVCDVSECVDQVEGCTDGDAWNYEELANVEDGSCSWLPKEVFSFNVIQLQFLGSDRVTLQFTWEYFPETPDYTDFYNRVDKFGVMGFRISKCGLVDAGEDICSSTNEEISVTGQMYVDTSFTLDYDEDDGQTAHYIIQTFNVDSINGTGGNYYSDGVIVSITIDDYGCTTEGCPEYQENATIDDGSCSLIDECGICGGSGIPETDCDCFGNTNIDACGICGGNSVYNLNIGDECPAGQSDYGNICTCDGAYECDECGICGGTGETAECGCDGIPDGACDCDGNVLDICGCCGGNDYNDGAACGCEWAYSPQTPGPSVVTSCGTGLWPTQGACGTCGDNLTGQAPEFMDDCNVCNGDGYSDPTNFCCYGIIGGCDGNCCCEEDGVTSTNGCDCYQNDDCGVCGGQGSCICDSSIECTGFESPISECSYSGELIPSGFYSCDCCCPDGECIGCDGLCYDCAGEVPESDICGNCGGGASDPTQCGCTPFTSIDGLEALQVGPYGMDCAGNCVVEGTIMDDMADNSSMSGNWFFPTELLTGGGELIVCGAGSSFGSVNIVNGLASCAGTWEIDTNYDWYVGDQTVVCDESIVCSGEDNPPNIGCSYDGELIGMGDSDGSGINQPIMECVGSELETITIHGTEYPDGYPEPFNNYNIYMGTTGICCPTGIYPDCTGQCRSFVDQFFNHPDECGTCPAQNLQINEPYCGGNPGDNCCDCAGVPNGDSKIDVCGTCGGFITDISECETQLQDCAGVVGGDAVIDNCGMCACPPNGISAVDGCTSGYIMYPNSTEDDCGYCWGYNDIFIGIWVDDNPPETYYPLPGNWRLGSNPLSGFNSPVTEPWDCGDDNNMGCPNVDQCGVCDGDSTTCAPIGFLSMTAETNVFGFGAQTIRIQAVGDDIDDNGDGKNEGGWDPVGDQTLERYILRIKNEFGSTLAGYPVEFHRDISGTTNSGLKPMPMENFVQIGHVHQFFEEGNYQISCSAYDSDQNFGYRYQELEITELTSLKQSINNLYMPYQGLHITASLSTYENSREWFEMADLDKRPTLGTFYYDEDQNDPTGNPIGWETIGQEFKMSDKGIPGASPNFTSSVIIDTYEDAMAWGLIQTSQLLYNTDGIDEDIEFYNSNPDYNFIRPWGTTLYTDGGNEGPSMGGSGGEGMSSAVDSGIKVTHITDGPSYPITIGGYEAGYQPTFQEEGLSDDTAPKIYEVEDDSEEKSLILIGYGFDKTVPVPDNYSYLWTILDFVPADSTKFYMFSTYIQAGDFTNSGYLGAGGRIDKWSGETGTFFTEEIILSPPSVIDGYAVPDQNFRINYRYDGYSRVKTTAYLESLSLGCTDPVSCNWDSGANYNDGSCRYHTNCIESSDNWGEPGDISAQGLPEEWHVLGCTDPTAPSYDIGSTYNDGSCGSEPNSSSINGKWRTSSGYKGPYYSSAGYIKLEYWSGTVLEGNFKNITKTQIRVRFEDDSTGGAGEPYRADVVWDGTANEIIFVDDPGSYLPVMWDESTEKMWYRVWVYGGVNAFDANSDNEVRVRGEIYPVDYVSGGDTVGSIYMFGPQLEFMNLGQEGPSPYLRAGDPADIGGSIIGEDLAGESWVNWTPDVDVRTHRSTIGRKSFLYEYYDYTYQRDKYLETTTPTEVLFYFYRRGGAVSTIFEGREPFQFSELNPLFVAKLDWGDGSDIEFTTEPKFLDGNDVITHTYHRPGTYEVTGYLFDGIRQTINCIDIGVSEQGSWPWCQEAGQILYGDVQGVISFKKFTTRFNLNPPVGEQHPIYVEYPETLPIVGGFSRNSIYYKSIARNLGYLFPPHYGINSELSDPINLDFKYNYDRLSAESALYQMDDRLLGEKIQAFTGSRYDQRNELGNLDLDIPQDDSTRIFKGSYSFGGELGKHPGNIDVGKVEFFTTGKLHIADLLGFVSQPLDQSFGIIEGRGAVLISAPHGCMNNRPTINAIHEQDDNTGALAVEIARLTGAHVIYGQYTVDDANFYHWIPDPGESSYYTPAYQDYIGQLLPYKERLKQYLETHPEIKIVIDYHGANYKRYFACDIGVRGPKSIPDEFSGPYGDDAYPTYSWEDAAADPEKYTPSLWSEWSRQNLLPNLYNIFKNEGIGQDPSDWPEPHCEDDVWDTSYAHSLGGWQQTIASCPNSWLDFYNNGEGSSVDLNNCCHSECANGNLVGSQGCNNCLDSSDQTEYNSNCVSNMMETGGICLQRFFTAKKRPTNTNFVTRLDEGQSQLEDTNYAGPRGWINEEEDYSELDAIQIEWSRVYRTIEPSTELKWSNGDDVGIGNGISACKFTNGCNRTNTLKNIKAVTKLVNFINSEYGWGDIYDSQLDSDEEARYAEALDNAWNIQKLIFEPKIYYPMDDSVEESNNALNPINDRYWKNVIPEEYDIGIRSGLYTYYDIRSNGQDTLDGIPICNTSLAAQLEYNECTYPGEFEQCCANDEPVVTLTLPQSFDLFYVWFDDPEYSWEHRTKLTIFEDGTLITSAGTEGTWDFDYYNGGLFTWEYSSGTKYYGYVDWNNKNVPHYHPDGLHPTECSDGCEVGTEVNTCSIEFTGRCGYFEIPKLDFGKDIPFYSDFGYQTVKRTDNTIYWPLETVDINDDLVSSIFSENVFCGISGFENGIPLQAMKDFEELPDATAEGLATYDGPWSWSGNLTKLYKNSYYVIWLCGETDSTNYHRLLIPSTNKDGNGIVTDNIYIDENSSQQWLGHNEYGNTYYYPVLPKLNKFGKFDENLGLQQAIYNPFDFESNLEEAVFSAEDEDIITYGDLPNPNIVTPEKIPFGTTGRKWNRADSNSIIQNNKIIHENKIIELSFEEIDEYTLNDLAGGNYGQLLTDYSIEYDIYDRTPETDGIKETDNLENIDKKNIKKAF